MTAAATQRSRSTKAGLGKAIAAQKATQDAPQLQREQPRHAPSSQKSVLLIEIKKFTKDLTPLQTHDRVTKGIRVADLRRFMDAYHLLDTSQVLKVIGTSERTLQRAAEKAKPLDMNVSDRALRLATVTSQAMDVLGSQEAAERWLSIPALGLGGRKPIDLLQSTQGTELVRTLLTRMDYGVYA